MTYAHHYCDKKNAFRINLPPYLSLSVINAVHLLTSHRSSPTEFTVIVQKHF